MTITPKDTVQDIVVRQKALFSMGAGRIVAALRATPAPKYVPLARRWWRDRRLRTRDMATLTMGELSVVEARQPSYEYFCTVLGVMLGLVRYNRMLPDGNPDWTAGFSIDTERIGQLRYLSAQRYFMAVQEGLEGIAKAWKKLEMPLSAAEMKARIKRPARGLVSVCCRYCQLMNGAVKMHEAWNTPWSTVYEAFEGCKYDNMEQRKMYEMNKPKKR